jgi:RNA polymerase sigma-70 factor (ECF subfamily)
VQAAMRHLKPRERELLWLAYVEGMSHAEIAAATGLGAMSIRILLYRARQKASQLLRPERIKS